MKNLILLVLIAFLLNSCVYDEKDMQESIERAYFEGQVDALEGDIRVILTDDGCWVWSSTPWEDKHLKVIYTPNSDCIETTVKY